MLISKYNVGHNNNSIQLSAELQLLSDFSLIQIIFALTNELYTTQRVCIEMKIKNMPVCKHIYVWYLHLFIGPDDIFSELLQCSITRQFFTLKPLWFINDSYI